MSPPDVVRVRHMVEAIEAAMRFAKATDALPALLAQLKSTNPPE